VFRWGSGTFRSVSGSFRERSEFLPFSGGWRGKPANYSPEHSSVEEVDKLLASPTRKGLRESANGCGPGNAETIPGRRYTLTDQGGPQ
jgi:hypothetical protein